MRAEDMFGLWTDILRAFRMSIPAPTVTVTSSAAACEFAGGTLIDDLNSLAVHAGARWFKADLHIHTPASYDFKWDGLDKNTFGAYQYVEAMLARGLSLVAITDHSSAAWIDKRKKRPGTVGNRVVLSFCPVWKSTWGDSISR